MSLIEILKSLDIDISDSVLNEMKIKNKDKYAEIEKISKAFGEYIPAMNPEQKSIMKSNIEHIIKSSADTKKDDSDDNDNNDNNADNNDNPVLTAISKLTEIVGKLHDEIEKIKAGAGNNNNDNADVNDNTKKSGEELVLDAVKKLNENIMKMTTGKTTFDVDDTLNNDPETIKKNANQNFPNITRQIFGD